MSDFFHFCLYTNFTASAAFGADVALVFTLYENDVPKKEKCVKIAPTIMFQYDIIIRNFYTIY